MSLLHKPIVVTLNPSLVTLSETKGLVVQLRTGSMKGRNFSITSGAPFVSVN